MQHHAGSALVPSGLLPTWCVVAGDCGRIMTGGTIGGNVIASQMLGWPAAQLYKDMYNPS